MVPDKPDRALTSEVIAIPTRPPDMGSVHDALARFWLGVTAHHHGAIETRWQVEFETAVGEIVANVVRHAHPPDSVPNPVRVMFHLFEDRIEAHLLDHGIPFVDPGPRAAAVYSIDQLPEGGWGLDLARGLVDHLLYERGDDGTNAWRLVKHFSGAAPADTTTTA
ncbi:MAG: ATP-binding protein [Chloroflexia bacterium]|nr:ATP-binding protein [Chloroflexia bacterium]MDQ3514613.1 ATP-binding protein [Chloroflexota bacterium]